MKWLSKRSPLPRLWALLLLAPMPATPHNGPPFPIITDRRVGPCVISLWTHPDVGTGTFWVMIEPPPGGSVPKDLKVEVGVEPVSGRLPQKRYPARLDTGNGPRNYYAEVPFDAEEVWRIHVFLDSSGSQAESSATVRVTPPGPARWEMLWYASPFAAIAFLWIRAMARRKKRLPPAAPAGH